MLGVSCRRREPVASPELTPGCLVSGCRPCPHAHAPPASSSPLRRSSRQFDAARYRCLPTLWLTERLRLVDRQKREWAPGLVGLVGKVSNLSCAIVRQAGCWTSVSKNRESPVAESPTVNERPQEMHS
jgi:hypothetical protein